jgi:hypothetical protein
MASQLSDSKEQLSVTAGLGQRVLSQVTSPAPAELEAMPIASNSTDVSPTAASPSGAPQQQNFTQLGRYSCCTTVTVSRTWT